MRQSTRPDPSSPERETWLPLAEQYRRARLFLFLAVLPGLLGLLVVAFQTHVHPVALLRDPLSLQGLAFYTGICSVVGGFLWSATAAILLFTAALTPREPIAGGDRRGFFLGFGLLTILLLFDDVLMLHDQILPLHLGVSELWAFALEAGLLLCLLLVYRREILVPEPLLFVLSLGLLSLSLAVDIFNDPTIKDRFWSVAEDLPKYLGILCWFSFFAKRCAGALGARLRAVVVSPPRPEEPGAPSRRRP